ncbi:MAG TPA: mycothiol system anti-sigma-R factor [Acidimicrobiales bacterium]|nr:mycothiol system anti-sigma-R factor [Acidimicrobiales bacterium]
MDEEPSIDELTGTGDCNDALQTLYHYLDGELTPERRTAIQRHLNQCAPCLHAFDFEAELKVVIARSCRDQVPAALRRRVAEVIEQASKSRSDHV